MNFQSRLYEIITKSNLVGAFSQKIVDRELMIESYNMISEDGKNLFSRYIFDVLDIACTDMKDIMKPLDDIYDEFNEFFREVIKEMKDIAGLDIDEETYTSLWIYMIFVYGSEVITADEKVEFLSKLTLSIDQDKVELCFKVLSLGDYLDGLLSQKPPKLEAIRNITEMLAVTTQLYNETLK